MNATIDTPLADLATEYPAASRRFHELGLDYCCGGGRSLSDACAAAGLDAGALLEEIEAGAGDEGIRWGDRPLPELVSHILSAFHEPLRNELPELVAMARKVEAVHGDKASCPKGLGDHLAGMLVAVEEHLEKEEQVLFPMPLAGRAAAGGAMAINVLTQEHDDHGLSLRQIRELTGGLVPPDDACTTWRALYVRLNAFEADLMQHVHLENNVLFPRALSESPEASTWNV